MREDAMKKPGLALLAATVAIFGSFGFSTTTLAQGSFEGPSISGGGTTVRGGGTPPATSSTTTPSTTPSSGGSSSSNSTTGGGAGVGPATVHGCDRTSCFNTGR
jgi:hypothetical protein